jgi:hypothetical protein
LAAIFATVDDAKALEYLNKALSYAQILDDDYYIASTNLELGDFYFVRKNNENAYKYFVQASKTSLSKENLENINSRIEDIKRRVSEQVFNDYQVKYGK